MTTRAIYAVTVLFLFLMTSSATLGQQNVVVVDMGRIFQEHLGFKASIDALQNEVEAFRATIQADRTRIQSESEVLAGMDRSSEDYKTKEAAMAKLAADMQVNHNMKNKDFMEREAELYYQTYVQILNAVQNFSRQNNISLVIRFSGEKIDPTDRASVLAGVNNVVVYQDKRDITDLIIQMVNGPSVAGQNGGNIQR